MAEPRSPQSYDVLILGAGIAGLTAAWRLAKAGQRVLLLDRAHRVGGVIISERHEGFLFEYGPNSFASFPGHREFFRELGLAERLQSRPLRTADRFVWHSGRLHRVPTGPGAFLGSGILPPAEKLRILRGVFCKCGPLLESDVTVGEFFRDRIGDAAVETLLKPALAGIYAADADRISLVTTFPDLAKAAREHGSLLAAMKAVRRAKGPGDGPKALCSFPDGLQELPQALLRAFRAAGGEVRHMDGARLEADGPGGARVVMQNGGSVAALQVVLATGFQGAARLLEGIAPGAARDLASLEAAGLMVVHAAVREWDVLERRDGFGFLCKRGEGVRMLGMIWSDRIFPGRAPQGWRLLTCFYGGDIDPEALELSDLILQRTLEADLRRTLGWQRRGLRVLSITRWTPALPLFRLGHVDRIERIARRLPVGFHLLGNYTGGVSIPDRVRRAGELAEHILAAKTPPRRERLAVTV